MEQRSEKETELIKDEMSEKIITAGERIAMEEGADKVNVRAILKDLGITNRVFYNRFRNIDEVLDIIYEKIAVSMRSGILSGLDPEKDFFTQVIDMMTATLVMTYRNKMNFNLYVFESDSKKSGNYEWWKGEIKKLIEFGQKKGLVKDIDTDVFAYSVWCFIRGFNADALMRSIPLERATEMFRYSFGILIDGLKK